jgi:hypothetical protein
VAVTFPTTGAYTNASWDAGCSTAGGDTCGTASDGTGSGVSSVTISLRNGTTSGNYWNGTGFSSSTEIFLSATGTSTWSFSFPATNFPADGQYRIRARSTDAAGNPSTTLTQDFTIDVT